jgi:DNA sulfur modification protein DndD
MILKKLIVENFRQFRGAHTIEFACEADRNVTLILAYNTFGKSALLNAINFALYGEVQPDLDDSTHLLNFEAEKSREKHFSVSLEFEFQGNSYHVERKRIYTYHGNSKVTAHDEEKLYHIETKSGSWKEIPHLQQLINRAIPKEMAPHFIFHGEKRVTQFATSGTHKEVGEAIRKILGCHLVELAIKDLLVIGKKIEFAVAKASGDAELEMLQTTLTSFEEKLRDVEEKIQRKEDEIDAKQTEREKLGEQLRDHERTKDLKYRLEASERARASCEENRNKVQREVWRWVKDSAITVASSAVAVTALEAIDQEELRGRIPPDYQETFIRGLLDGNMCICNRELTKGSAEWNAVEALLQPGGKKDVLDAVLRAKSSADRYMRSISRAKTELSGFEDRLRSLNSELGGYERDIEEHKQRLQGVDVKDLAKKAELYNRLDTEVQELNKRIGDLERKKKVELLPEIDKFKKEIERKIRSRPEVEKKRRIVDLVGEISAFLNQQLVKYEDEARKKVLQYTNENLGVMHRDKEAFFDPKLNLGLREKDTKIQGGKSTGEAQLLVLAFTSALIKFCSERERQDDEFLIPGTVAPLVLDAPFGQLDSVFQTAAISWIPKMARQVVLFVSDSQARFLQESKEAMERVGACYVIQIPPGPRPTRPYLIDGQNYAGQNSREDKSTSLQRIW